MDTYSNKSHKVERHTFLYVKFYMQAMNTLKLKFKMKTSEILRNKYVCQGM